MPLIVEDGTGVIDANTYNSIADADVFFTLRQNDTWLAQDDAAKTADLVEAADYMSAFYRPRNTQLTNTQGLPFPTYVDGVPEQVKTAQLLLAAAAMDGPLVTPVSAGAVTYEREKMDGVGETETHYGDGPSTGRAFPQVNALLGPFTIGSANGGLQLVRRLVG